MATGRNSFPVARTATSILILLLAFGYFALRLANIPGMFPSGWAWDFTINLTAAKGLQSGLSLYDREALRNLAAAEIAPGLARGFSMNFNSYVGPPSTALLFLPFSSLPLSTGTAVYRLLLLPAFAASVLMSGFALSPKDRARGWLWGGVALLVLDSVTISIEAGQVDAWEMLALAGCLWAAGRGRWGLVGVGAGLAALLKVSPGIIIVYCLLRGKWRAAVAAGLTGAVLLGSAAIAGQPSDLWRFFFEVLPSLSGGTLHAENQSLAAWLARILATETDFSNFAIELGIFRLVGPAIGAAVMASLWVMRRRQPFHTLELGILILLALVVGPVTWEHYTAWAILPLVLMADGRLWGGWSRVLQIELSFLVALGGILLSHPALGFSNDAVASNWWLRLAMGTGALGLSVWLVVCFLLLKGETRKSPESSPCAST